MSINLKSSEYALFTKLTNSLNTGFYQINEEIYLMSKFSRMFIPLTFLTVWIFLAVGNQKTENIDAQSLFCVTLRIG